jgi:hypothetical protein
MPSLAAQNGPLFFLQAAWAHAAGLQVVLRVAVQPACVSQNLPFLGQSAGHWQVMLSPGGGWQNANAQYGNDFIRLTGGSTER